MLLAIDIGNTTIGFALIHKGRIVSVVKIDTASSGWEDQGCCEKKF